MPDLDITLGQQVQQESTDENLGRDCDLLSIPSTKAHLFCVEVDQSRIGDRDAVGVSPQVPIDLLRTAERGFAVHNPIGSIQHIKQCGKAIC